MARPGLLTPEAAIEATPQPARRHGPPRVACIGECMVELFERPDGSLTRGFGGDTLNTAIYLARLGVAVDYVTALGDDPFSDAMLAGWQQEGVGTGLVLRAAGQLPGLYIIQTDAAGERRFSHWRDSAPARRLLSLPGSERIAASLRQHAVLYLSGVTLSLFNPADLGALFGLLDEARRRGARVAFDTNFRLRGWPDLALARAVYGDMLRRSDIVFAGWDDLAPLFGDSDPDAMLARLRGCQAAEALLKLPHATCHLQAGLPDLWVAIESVPKIVDTTAAGDSFAAGYLAARLQGSKVAVAARAGHRLASIVICHRGAIIPRRFMPETA